MQPILIKDLINAVSGKIEKQNIDNLYIENVSIDSRNIKKGDLFIPIIGANFDGHDFINIAFEKGAKACLTQKNIKSNGLLIKVSDTKKALKDLAKYYRSLFNIPAIAITGSTGKTTTKDIVYSVLSQKFNVLKTEGNFNNEIGLPLTIFKLTKEHEIIVLEMGMNSFGEIKRLSEIAQPKIAVITNIGVSHIGKFKNKEDILKAKTEIFEYLEKDGLKILNADDDFLYKLPKDTNIVFYSIQNKADVFAKNIKETTFDTTANITCFDKNFDIKLNILGKHMILNALAAIAIGNYFNIPIKDIQNALQNICLSKMRMEIINTENNIIINDSYNASPSSIKAALDVLANFSQNKVAIIGDMLELGEFSFKYHFEIGKYAALKNLNTIIFIGNDAKYMLKGAKENINGFNTNLYYFENKEKCFEVIKDIIKKDDVILIKASRGMQLEKTIDKLKR